MVILLHILHFQGDLRLRQFYRMIEYPMLVGEEVIFSP